MKNSIWVAGCHAAGPGFAGETERRDGLATVAQSQEEIKRVVAMAEGVSLTATNALLVAKRAGTSSVGFGVVAREMRGFSGRLVQTMQDLMLRVYALVEAEAVRMQRVRNMGKLCRACKGGEGAMRHLDGACGRSREALQMQASRLLALQASLLEALARAEKQCAMGVAVGRGARIEAAHSGGCEQELRQIAADMEGAVGGLIEGVRKLRKTAAGGMA
ncbi:MAG TPA: hypothetical protein VMV75_09310 [Sulfuricella sp.]|nr:hypothetical protein [Sulfuricella sp.]